MEVLHVFEVPCCHSADVKLNYGALKYYDNASIQAHFFSENLLKRI